MQTTVTDLDMIQFVFGLATKPPIDRDRKGDFVAIRVQHMNVPFPKVGL